MATSVHLHRLSNPVRTRKSLIWPWMASDVVPVHRITLANTVLKTQAAVGNPRIQPGEWCHCLRWNGRTVGLHAGAKSRQRWLFYAYDRIRRTDCWRTSSVNALWRHWSVLWACCRPLRSWYGWRMAGRCMNHAWRESCALSASVTLQRIERL